MAASIRIAKSSGDWTTNELAAYNITVKYQDAATFFETDNFPQPTIDPSIFTASDSKDGVDGPIYRILRAMELAMSPDPEGESVDDFTALLLRALGYTKERRVLRTRKEIPLVICAENKHAKIDVCVIDENRILLLAMQEAKAYMDIRNAEPLLIADVIAAFAENNQTRQQMFGQPPLVSKVMAGITMNGTAPIFYKIEVTTALVTAVAGGFYPEESTTVYAHTPNIPRPTQRFNEGMKPLDNRAIIISCFEAFKKFVN